MSGDTLVIVLASLALGTLVGVALLAAVQSLATRRIRDELRAWLRLAREVKP